MSRATLASERGAVLIQAAVTAMVMIGFGTFVADYGVLWIARHQAQNAADAGAMAGAIARAYDDFDDPPAAGGVADLNASQIAGANPVWGAPSAPVTSFTCPADIVAVDPNSRCVKVDAHRDGESGSTALPTFFGPLLGVATQGVRATATARVMVANATNCLRPWAIPDKWTEAAGSPDEFNKYGPGGALLTPHDDYTPPDASGPGPDPDNSYRFANSNADIQHFGLAVPLTLYRALSDPIVPGWLVPLHPPGSTYAASRDACNGQSIAVGDQIPIDEDQVPISTTAPIPFDFHNMYAADSSASWNGRAIDDSCAPLLCSPASAISPRLVAIAVFDVDLFQLRRESGDWSGCKVAPPCVDIVNIVGFFIGDPTGAFGNLTSYPGLIPTDAPRLTAASSFLKAVTLVR